MHHRHLAAPALTAVVLALSSAQMPLHAQPAATDSGTTTTTTPRAAAAQGSKVNRADQRLIRDIAQANMAEVETGKLALEKSQNEQVKTFAQKMIDDHTSALNDVQQLAQAKNVDLPDGVDLKHKALATSMRAMSGANFDRDYKKHAGLADHRQTHDLLQKTQRNAKDPDLKALAAKMLPVVDGHLKMAEQMGSR
ncbi:MAG: hypothetical protein JWQ03_50 [Variovorax sp.]|nr:hypothetical protein [Variovorax sp.]